MVKINKLPFAFHDFKMARPMIVIPEFSRFHCFGITGYETLVRSEETRKCMELGYLENAENHLIPEIIRNPNWHFSLRSGAVSIEGCKFNDFGEVLGVVFLVYLTHQGYIALKLQPIDIWLAATNHRFESHGITFKENTVDLMAEDNAYKIEIAGFAQELEIDISFKYFGMSDFLTSETALANFFVQCMKMEDIVNQVKLNWESATPFSGVLN